MGVILKNIIVGSPPFWNTHVDIQKPITQTADALVSMNL
jgi:hypothetical protein